MSLANYVVPSLIPSMFSAGRFFDNDFFNSNYYSMPHSNIEQTDNAINVELAVPGFREEEVDVRLDGNLLKIQAEHSGHDEREEKDSKGKPIGRSKWQSSSKVYESFRLPSGLNLSGMQKTIDNGMLKLTIPKLAIADRPQQQQEQQPQQQQLQQQQGQQQGKELQGGQYSQQQGQQQKYGQQQRQQWQQLQWPPQVHTKDAGDGKHVTYTIPLPSVNRDDIRINIDNGNLYLTVFEHGSGHAFDKCTTCSRNNGQQQKQGHAAGGYDEQQRLRDINGQCNQFNERSCVIRLPFGTTADGVDAKFEKGQLMLNVEKKGHWGTSIPIH